MDAVGYVFDKKDNSPLPGVNIAVRNTAGNITGQGTTTDARGFFNLTDIPAGHVVEFRFIGYQTQLPMLRDFNVALNRIYLERVAYEQPEVVINGNPPKAITVRVNALDAIAFSLFILLIGYAGYHLIIGK